MSGHLSHSSLSTYKDCGEKYRLTKLVGVPELPGWALVGGSAVHAATEELDRRLFGLGTDAPATFLGAFETECHKTIEGTGVPEVEWRISGKKTKDWPEKETKDWWLFHGESFVQNYVNWRNRYTGNIWVTPNGEPAIEIRIDATFGGTAVVGYIDRIFEEGDHLRVVDLKAGRTTPTDPAQLAAYAWGLPAEWPVPTRGSYFMARDGFLAGDYDLTGAKPLLDYEYGTAKTAIDAGYFPARAGFMCGYCPVRDYCWLQNGDMAEAVKPF